MNKGLAQYQQVNRHSAVEGASPHRLVQMLMEGSLQRLAEAKGAIQRKDISSRGEALSKAIAIIGGLRDSLNVEKGGQLAENLDNLYDYMSRELIQANQRGDTSKIDEIAELMRTVKSGWDGIQNAVS